MAQKPIYVLVAIVGIGLASGAAWWLQNKPSSPAASAALAPATTAPAGAARSGGGTPGVEVTRVKVVQLTPDRRHLP